MTKHYGTSILAVLIMAIAITVSSSPIFAFSFGKYEKVKAASGVVSIPVASVTDGKAHFFSYVESGKEIAFFVVKAPDGNIRTAFDACDVCYKEKKGYEQKGDAMICKNCNKKFPANRIGPNSTGGCNPSYLPHQQTGNMVTIKVADIKNGGRLF